MLFKIKTSLRRFLNRLFKTHRPASYPFLSGDGFRSVANFIHDQFLDFDPKKVSKGDIIYVRSNFLEDFFQKVHPLIKEPYVLVSGNEDGIVGLEFKKYIDEKIIHWYAQNLFFKDPKTTLLPIGIENFMTECGDNLATSLKRNTPYITSENTSILFGFNVDEKNEERKELYRILSNSPLATHISKPRAEYYKTLGTYKFIASPSGAGIDCHRTWEAFYYKVIPILIRSDFSEQLETLGFPVLLLDKWSDISNMDKDTLNKYYDEHKESFNNAGLYLPYWYQLFSSYR